MFKKYLTLTLTFLIINLFFSGAIYAETNSEKEAKFAEKVKINITKLSTGTDAKIELKLKDGTKLKGYVSQIGEDSFVVNSDKNGASIEIPYPNVQKVKGKNLKTGVSIAAWIGLAALIVFVVAAVIIDGKKG